MKDCLKHSRHKGPTITLSWKTSIGVKTRLDVGHGSRSKLPHVIRQAKGGRKVLVITQPAIAKNNWLDEIISGLEKEELQVTAMELPDGEDCKSARVLLSIWNRLQEEDFDRTDTVVGLGGGAISDVAGFAASTYKRGTNLVLVPTTLLAQVDAAIGGKTGINLEGGKNLAGTFFFPRAVIVDHDFFSTLPRNQFKSALAEIVKYGLLEETITSDSEYTGGHQPLLELLDGISNEKHTKIDAIMESSQLSGIILSCIKMKLNVVAADAREGGLRRCLNLGHTVGHAVEKESAYAISHGEAVSIGLVKAYELAEKLGRIDGAEAARVTEILEEIDLPTAIPDSLSRKGLFDAVTQDKKRAGDSIKFVLPETHLGIVNYNFELPLEKIESVL